MAGPEIKVFPRGYSDLYKILLEGLRAADPRLCVERSLRIIGDCVDIRGLRYCGFRRVHVVGFGKASRGMAEGVYRVLGDLVAGGVVISPSGTGSIGPIAVLKGDHPRPGRNTLEASRRLLDYIVGSVGERDLLIALVSGGGSALFEVPADDISLDDIAWVSEQLMKSGADIYEINTVRKHLSAVKGGRLLRFARAGAVVSLIISDVVGDDIGFIASGPTAPDETTFRDAKAVLERYGLWERAPESVRNLIEEGVRGSIPETPKPGDPVFRRVRNIIVASNIESLKAMEASARKLGYNTIILTPLLHGEAREVARVIASIAVSSANYGVPVGKPAAIIAGGETTVTVRGNGIGGRNQELCLAISIEIRSVKGSRIEVACMGSDGIDGVSPAAGAVVDNTTYSEALEKGLYPQGYLEENDSYTFFKMLGRTIETGYTGTNVNDFVVALVR